MLCHLMITILIEIVPVSILYLLQTPLKYMEVQLANALFNKSKGIGTKFCPP
jgi:hypothetical protein